jgi:hypothetical protein
MGTVTVHRFADEIGLRAGAAFFVAVALGIGAVLFGLLTRPGARRPAFRSLRAWRRGPAALAGLALAASIFGAFWWSSLRGFRELVLDGDRVRLVGFLPPGTTELNRDELARVLFEPGLQGRSRLVLELRDGSMRSSVSARTEQIFAAQADLERR